MTAEGEGFPTPGTSILHSLKHFIVTPHGKVDRLAPTLVGERADIQAAEVKIVRGGRFALKDFPHNCLPLFTVGFNLTELLPGDQVTDFMGDDFVEKLVLVFSQQHRIKVYPVLLQKGGAGILTTATETDQRQRELTAKISRGDVREAVNFSSHRLFIG